MTTCVCGEEHKSLEDILERMGVKSHIYVEVAELGTWVVPRAYVLAHGLNGKELPTLAKKHRWRMKGQTL